MCDRKKSTDSKSFASEIRGSAAQVRPKMQLMTTPIPLQSQESLRCAIDGSLLTQNGLPRK